MILIKCFSRPFSILDILCKTRSWNALVPVYFHKTSSKMCDNRFDKNREVIQLKMFYDAMQSELGISWGDWNSYSINYKPNINRNFRFGAICSIFNPWISVPSRCNDLRQNFGLEKIFITIICKQCFLPERLIDK